MYIIIILINNLYFFKLQFNYRYPMAISSITKITCCIIQQIIEI